MATKFKVGDRVRVVYTGHSVGEIDTSSEFYNRVGTVQEYTSSTLVEVHLDGDRESTGHFAWRLLPEAPSAEQVILKALFPSGVPVEKLGRVPAILEKVKALVAEAE